MSAFFVGQRVRCVKGRGKPAAGASARVGDEGIVKGTPSQPNGGFNPECGDYSVYVPRVGLMGMVMSWQIEPIIPEGMQPAKWEDCLWQPEGVAA